MLNRFLALGFVCILGEAGAGGQSSDPSVLHVDVRQVLVPVVVTDNKGHHVTGLKPSDFHVFEDGVAQEIVGFSTDTQPAGESVPVAPSEGARTAGQPAASASHSTGRTFVICIDALHSAFANSARTRQALLRLFEKEKGTDAQYVLLSIGRQLQVLQPATQDPAAIASKLNSPGLQSALGGGDAANLKSELNDLKIQMYAFCSRCDCNSERACYLQAQDLKVKLDGQSERWALLRERFLTQLKSVVEELAKLPNGRSLILISDGFSLQPAREFYGVAAAFVPKDQRFKMSGSTDLEPRLQSVIQVAVERNVRIYCLDSRRLEQSSFSSTGSMDASAPSDRPAQSVLGRGTTGNRGGTLLTTMDRQSSSVALQNGSGMEQLARATGGIYFNDSNDMLKQFRAVLADGREYYLLAYIPTNREPDGKFHRIVVEVSEKKLNVRVKSGYWSGPITN